MTIENEDAEYEDGVRQALLEVFDLVDRRGAPFASIAISIWIAAMPAPLRELFDEAVARADAVGKDPQLKSIGLHP